MNGPELREALADMRSDGTGYVPDEWVDEDGAIKTSVLVRDLRWRYEENLGGDWDTVVNDNGMSWTPEPVGASRFNLDNFGREVYRNVAACLLGEQAFHFPATAKRDAVVAIMDRADAAVDRAGERYAEPGGGGITGEGHCAVDDIIGKATIKLLAVPGFRGRVMTAAKKWAPLSLEEADEERAAAVWRAWHELPDGAWVPASLDAIAERLGMETAYVAAIVYPDGAMGVWHDDDEKTWTVQRYQETMEDAENPEEPNAAYAEVAFSDAGWQLDITVTGPGAAFLSARDRDAGESAWKDHLAQGVEDYVAAIAKQIGERETS